MKPITLKEFERFYLEAALTTYAAAEKVEDVVPGSDTHYSRNAGQYYAEKSTIPELPGSKKFLYRRDDLCYVDTYWTNGEFSGGTTIIYAGEVPVWLMAYDGWCQDDDKEVLDFLKSALRANYEGGIFLGGRGPREFHQMWPTKERLVYHNHLDLYGQGFRCFAGRERIFRRPADAIDLFWHRYKGLALFEGDSFALPAA